MRRSGLTHLLSVSGLHIAAVVGATMLLTLRLLALSQHLALRTNLILVSAGVGAAAGIGYTLLTGAQVPTVRSCIAALLVLAGIALGRDAISIRLLAVGALVVLLFRPEALAGASFQFSFAAVAAIVALHSSAWARRHLQAREEPWWARLLRWLLGMIATGLAVEAALIPFALFHFHKAGLYGVAANIIAIPLTTFVIMPLEALALLLDSAGVGAPVWTLTGWSLSLLLGLAHAVASTPGAVATLASMPPWALAFTIIGGLWLCLWTTQVRLVGLVPVFVGATGAVLSPTPDLLITGDGRHVAIVRAGIPLLVRERSGEFVGDIVAEAAGYDGEPRRMEGQPMSHCTRDSCVASIAGEGRSWRLLATRSSTRIDWPRIVRACAQADIVVADRWLPKACNPRWLKLDRQALERSGGVAIYLDRQPRIETVSQRIAAHPWAPLNSVGSAPPGGPGSERGADRSAAPRNSDWLDRAGSFVPHGGRS
jgi:competence protein ComEC